MKKSKPRQWLLSQSQSLRRRLLSQSLNPQSKYHSGPSAEETEVPTYEAVCRDCEVATDYTRSVDDRMDTPTCVSCGEKMQKVIYSAPKGFVTGKFEAFKSHVDGSLITNHRELQEHNRRNNVVSMADGYSDETIKKGEFMKPEEKDINDLKADIAEATAMVNQGYKPQTEVYTDD